jgi:hypothetical protein
MSMTTEKFNELALKKLKGLHRPEQIGHGKFTQIVCEECSRLAWSAADDYGADDPSWPCPTGRIIYGMDLEDS